MRIALIGTRGVPARYGGFETCAEELGRRFVRDGLSVDVFCRAGYYGQKIKQYLGMNLIYLPYLRFRSLDTLSHSLISLLYASMKRYDVLLVFNPANGPFLILPKVSGLRTVLNVDGLEWEREKWNRLGKAYHRWSARVAARLADILVADSREIQRYYVERFGRRTEYLSYGADLESSQEPGLLGKYGLAPRDYFLQITRFEPENNPLLSVQAFRQLRTEKKLVLVGGARYRSSYSERIAAERSGRVRLLGFVYDAPVLRELRTNCLAYIHGNEVGGTNPALLQAMASGCLVLARDTVFNREVLGEAGLYFSRDDQDLAAQLRWVIDHQGVLDPYQSRAKDIIVRKYQWEAAARSYERLFRQLTGPA
jgi:glycosyltransferase involved in cell wall biosynthesis